MIAIPDFKLPTSKIFSYVGISSRCKLQYIYTVGVLADFMDFIGNTVFLGCSIIQNIWYIKPDLHMCLTAHFVIPFVQMFWAARVKIKTVTSIISVFHVFVAKVFHGIKV